MERVVLPPPSSPGEVADAIEERVLFAAGSTELDDTAVATLDRLVARLQTEAEEYRVELHGTGDDVSEGPDDRRLARARAAMVRRYLGAAGVPVTRTVEERRARITDAGQVLISATPRGTEPSGREY